MANKDVFCNVPWTNLHLYWNGDYGFCCNAITKPKTTDNIKTTSVIQWYNSSHIQDFRNKILGNKKLPECGECYHSESIGKQSKRVRENFKTAIFPELNFEKSFLQSKWAPYFTEVTHKPPVDWHIDLGNECNLMCKMCNSDASSKISAQYKKWNIKHNIDENWTNDNTTWEQFLVSVKNSSLTRLHLMGGEPTVNKRFYQLLDFIVLNKLTNISFSFVTNGTNISPRLIETLNKIDEVNIEISIETIDESNDYIRQGTTTQKVLENIEFILTHTKHQLVLRTAPQMLSVGSYYNLIRYAWEKNLFVQSIPVTQPEYFYIPVLPYNYRQSIKILYVKLLDQIIEQSKSKFTTLSVGRDPNHLDQQFINEITSIINLLDKPELTNTEKLRLECTQWMRKWDDVTGLNAYDYYPDLSNFFKQYGY
jgi:sulfatase maturation enzyme AslB (radical SAM superfamily)